MNKSTSIFLMCICQILGRALDYPDETMLDLTFQNDTSSLLDCSCVPKHTCTSYYEDSTTGENTDGREFIIPK